MNDVLFAEDWRSSNAYKKQLKYVEFIGGAAAVLFVVFANLFTKRYIYVYSDRIVCKKELSKEQIVVCSPNEYTLKINPVPAEFAENLFTCK